MYAKKVGSLQVGRLVRSSGKVVDAWNFASPFSERGNGPVPPKFVVQVAMIKDEGNASGITFEARCPEGLTHPIRDAHIGQLHKKVEEALQFQHDMLTGVQWEDWLEIAVTGSHNDTDNYVGVQANLKLAYRTLKRAVDPRTNRAFVINSNGLAVDFPQPKKAGERDPSEEIANGIRLGGRDLNSEYSYMPATPENLASLAELQSRLNELRARMSAFLTQDAVAQSLANLGTNTLALPSPI